MKTDTSEVGISRRIDVQNEDELEHLAALFRLLSDRTRLNLLFLLADGERNVSALCDSMRLPQPTISHHLGLLRMSHIIANRREGKQVFYSLNGRVTVGEAGGLDVGTDRFSVRITKRGPA